MVVSPAKRPMPWSAWTTRSPTARLDASVSTSLPRLWPRAAHQPVAENVLLADDGEARRLEAGLERQHGEARGRLRRRQHLLPRVDAKRVADAVLGKKRGKPLLAPLLQQATSTRLPSPWSRSA